MKECSFLLLSVDAYITEPISNSFATPFHLIKRKKERKKMVKPRITGHNHFLFFLLNFRLRFA